MPRAAPNAPSAASRVARLERFAPLAQELLDCLRDDPRDQARQGRARRNGGSACTPGGPSGPGTAPLLLVDLDRVHHLADTAECGAPWPPLRARRPPARGRRA